MKYFVLTESRSAEAHSECVKKFGLSEENNILVRFNGGTIRELRLSEAIEMLPLKNGCDFVMFDNGNLGFVGYNNTTEAYFEIIG